MAQKTLLQIINAAQGELGLPQATVITAATDQTTIQMYGFANAILEELRQAKDDGWTALQKEYNLVINVPVVTTGDLTANSAVITNIPTTVGLLAGYMMISGPSIPTAARILSIDSATQITMTMECTATEVGAALTFMQDTYPEPSDFGYFVNKTWWDRTNHWELLGPDSPQMDQWHRSGIVATGPRRHFRQLGALVNTYRVWPPPAEITAPLQLVFEYVSTDCVYVNGGVTTAASFANDTDIPILSDRAIIMGIKWKFWEQKGFDWTQKRTDYDNYVDRLIARDGGRKTLSLVGRQGSMFMSSSNVQDGFFPGPIGPNMS